MFELKVIGKKEIYLHIYKSLSLSPTQTMHSQSVPEAFLMVHSFVLFHNSFPQGVVMLMTFTDKPLNQKGIAPVPP